MTRKKYIITVTVAYAIGAFLWVYFSDRIIEGIGGSIGFGLYSTFKGFVFVAVTTVLLYLALRRLAEIRPDARPLTTVRGWTAFGLLVLLMLPVLLVSYAVYRSASDKLLEERLAQLEFMTEAVARSIDAEVQRQLAQTPTETPLATIHRMLDGGNAGFGRLAAFAGLMGESAQVVIADRTGRGPWRIAGRDEALPDGLARLAGRVAAGTAVDILELTDGERMLAAAADIPAAGAVLMATINTRDVVDDVRGVAFLSALTAAAFLLAAVVLAVLIAQRQKLAATLALAEQQEALHAAEARFRATFEQAAVGIAHLDLDGRFLRVNETLCTLLGYDREALTGRRYADVRPDIQSSAKGAEGHSAGEALPIGALIEARGDRLHRTQDGREIWLSCVQSIARDAPQDQGYVILVAADATARRAAERRLTLAEVVFTGTQEGLVVTDLDGRVTAVNPAFTAITGYDEAEAVGQNMRLLKSGRQDQLFYQMLWAALRKAGIWRGEMWNRRKDGTLFLQQTVISAVNGPAGTPVSYVGAFNDITAARRSEIEVDRLTRYDPLTGLPNRSLVFSLIEHELTRADTKCALLYIDIDQLKTINDSLGFAAGDAALCALAKRIRRAAPEDATIGRYGADEFVVLIDGNEGAEAAIALAGRLIDTLAEPVSDAGTPEVVVNASIGISLFPQDADDADTLLQHAHSALIEAKSRGGPSYAFYTDDLTRAAKARMQLIANLRRAVAEREFVVHYQPIIRLEDTAIVGAEALVRWVTPDGEVISPERFIPVAEDTGLILPLGDFVLATACEQMARWKTAGLPCDFVAVNISGRQLEAPDFCARTAAAIAAAGLAAESIEFEITETMLLRADSDAESKLKAIAEMGVRIAIDDFGTGYSSLAYLKRFPISRLKIDKSFVNDLPASLIDGELVRAMIAMAKALHIETLAEGVEEAGQMAFLAAHGCTLAQGYYWSRPVTPERFEALLPGRAGSPPVPAGTG